MKRSVWLSGAVALASIVSMSFSVTAARASTVYDWTLTGASFSGTGTITLSSTEDTTNNGGGYLATGMTGEINSVVVTSPTDYYGSDNLPSAASWYFEAIQAWARLVCQTAEFEAAIIERREIIAREADARRRQDIYWRRDHRYAAEHMAIADDDGMGQCWRVAA